MDARLDAFDVEASGQFPIEVDQDALILLRLAIRIFILDFSQPDNGDRVSAASREGQEGGRGIQGP